MSTSPVNAAEVPFCRRRQLTVSLLLISVLAGCSSAPLDYPRQASFAISDTSATVEATEVAT
ncbi:MAG: hypothetical protein O3A63_08285 [Proteobacteria bacterium]|nr:hypothetical protein [Pseudomonadota bacterium]